MSYNTFGQLFRFTSWGESHGPAIGAVIDGCPPGLLLTEEIIQPFLDARKPGTSRHVTQRREDDCVKILSGVFNNRTTGAPISLMIENTDARSKDYGEIENTYRPGHADYTYDKKYGFRDYRGGGRASARETAVRVAAGAVARQILGEDIRIAGALVQIGTHPVTREDWSWDEVQRNALFCPSATTLPQWETVLDETRKAGSSIGAIVEVVAHGVPAGWGAPVYGKLDADLASAMMSIPAAKGVEIGAGFGAVGLSGEQNADEMRMSETGSETGGKNGGKNGPLFLSNNNGGVLGGISSGQDVVVRTAFKPTSSILTPRKSVDRQGEDVDVRTKGRHDPCVGVRAAPIAEAMLACVLADHKLRHRGQCG